VLDADPVLVIPLLQVQQVLIAVKLLQIE